MIGAILGIGSLAGNAITSAMNYNQQKRELAYQHALQERIFQREDSAYQRTVKDMRAAGLSPLSMNGTNGAGEAIATQAPQNDFDAGAAVGSLLNAASAMEDLKTKKLLNQKQELENRFAADTYNDRIGRSSADLSSVRLSNIMASYLNADRKRQDEFNEFFNINDGMSEKERAAAFALKALGQDYTTVGSFSDEFGRIFKSSISTGQKVLGGLATASENVSDVLNEAYDKATEKVEEVVDKLKSTDFKGVLKDVATAAKNFVTGSKKKPSGSPRKRYSNRNSVNTYKKKGKK